jgi:hypothetical protein
MHFDWLDILPLKKDTTKEVVALKRIWNLSDYFKRSFGSLIFLNTNVIKNDNR